MAQLTWSRRVSVIGYKFRREDYVGSVLLDAGVNPWVESTWTLSC